MIKRFFDIFASLLGLVLLSPVFIIITLCIKLRTPGPVLFKQKRVGKNGKEFIIVKYRTMIINHEGNTISVKGENRITTLGAFLRKYKLDELPELWNVFIGDMSMVGPRPDVPEYANRLVGDERQLLELRPGITGPASLKYSNEEELLESQSDPLRYYNEVIWPEKVRINLNYYRNRTFIGDIIVIFQTIFSLGEVRNEV